jgi:hypothetical protein
VNAVRTVFGDVAVAVAEQIFVANPARRSRGRAVA